MDAADLVWGLVLISAGVFVAVYGSMLFKFALAAMGFGIGFAAAWWILGETSATSSVQVLVSLAAGGILAFAAFALIRFGLYIAGGILGLVLSFLVIGCINIWGDTNSDFLTVILAVAGVAGGGFLAPRLGSMITIFATAAAGAFLIVQGLGAWFESRFGQDASEATQVLGQRLTIVTFLVFFGMAALSQWQSTRLTRRVLN